MTSYTCPQAPKKKNKIKTISRRGNPKQLFHECIIFKGTHEGRYVLAEMCDTCRRLPINETTVCSQKHKEFLKRVALSDTHNEIGFKSEKHFLTFPISQQEKVEVLLQVLRIDFLRMHISDQVQIQDLEQQFKDLKVHPGVDLEEALEADPQSSLSHDIMTYVESDISYSDADKLEEFAKILAAKSAKIPAQTFRIKNDQLLMSIKWPKVGAIMINVTRCKDGEDIYKELKYTVKQLI